MVSKIRYWLLRALLRHPLISMVQCGVFPPCRGVGNDQPERLLLVYSFSSLWPLASCNLITDKTQGSDDMNSAFNGLVGINKSLMRTSADKVEAVRSKSLSFV